MVEAGVELKQESAAKKIKLEHNNQENDDDVLSEKIKQQLDYYFSDVNIIRDKFLLGEIKKDDGWVKLSVLLTFSRLQQLTKDENRIIEALKKCHSDVIEFDDSKKQIRRKNKLPDAEEYKKNLDLRTVHLSGFPTDYTFDQLRTFCSQFGDVESVAMRRHFKTRFFKGCIHVVYKRIEDANKILPREPLMCKDRELRSESMENYYKRKAEIAQKRMKMGKNKKNRGDDTKSDDKESGGDQAGEETEPKQPKDGDVKVEQQQPEEKDPPQEQQSDNKEGDNSKEGDDDNSKLLVVKKEQT